MWCVWPSDVILDFATRKLKCLEDREGIIPFSSLTCNTQHFFHTLKMLFIDLVCKLISLMKEKFLVVIEIQPSAISHTECCQVMIVHTFNPNTWETEAGGSL